MSKWIHIGIISYLLIAFLLYTTDLGVGVRLKVPEEIISQADNNVAPIPSANDNDIDKTNLKDKSFKLILQNGNILEKTLTLFLFNFGQGYLIPNIIIWVLRTFILLEVGLLLYDLTLRLLDAVIPF